MTRYPSRGRPDPLDAHLCASLLARLNGRSDPEQGQGKGAAEGQGAFRNFHNLEVVDV